VNIELKNWQACLFAAFVIFSTWILLTRVKYIHNISLCICKCVHRFLQFNAFSFRVSPYPLWRHFRCPWHGTERASPVCDLLLPIIRRLILFYWNGFLLLLTSTVIPRNAVATVCSVNTVTALHCGSKRFRDARDFRRVADAGLSLSAFLSCYNFYHTQLKLTNWGGGGV
jgi:hypothetical protein